MDRVELDRVTRLTIGSVMKVHSSLGPGMLEGAYEVCLAYELGRQGLRVDRQVEVPVTYEGLQVGVGYRMDLLVAGEVVVELKTVEKLNAQHRAQLLSYLRFGGRRVGLLLNFHALRLKDGIMRLVNDY